PRKFGQDGVHVIIRIFGSITGRARRHGLHTDASHRYERGVDPALQYKALERATRLLIDLCGGEAGPVIDVTNEETLPKRA
ncbi:phenylalanine--tRNA ligase beta subunit-related protein, partial [Klebsiella pneumoniae]|uniref:phenylalanine--tRNA ligase beta subunit-related protein n=1 Tax=Klebsiella pneumoniae TaxID=573 RepID=UPI00272F9FD7